MNILEGATFRNTWEKAISAVLKMKVLAKKQGIKDFGYTIEELDPKDFKNNRDLYPTFSKEAIKSGKVYKVIWRYIQPHPENPLNQAMNSWKRLPE